MTNRELQYFHLTGWRGLVMARVVVVLIILSICLNHAESFPREYQRTVGKQHFCGRELADVLRIVCHGRGYNNAFSDNDYQRNRRFKRGIVDECCYRGCGIRTLESYCSPVTPSSESNINLKKRSENLLKQSLTVPDVSTQVRYRFFKLLADENIENLSETLKSNNSTEKKNSLVSYTIEKKDPKIKYNGKVKRDSKKKLKIDKNQPISTSIVTDDILEHVSEPSDANHRFDAPLKINTESNRKSHIGTVKPYYKGFYLLS